MLQPWEISCHYINSPLKVPSVWNLSRKHVRLRTLDNRFVKLNKFENRINDRELRDYCVYIAPIHAYFSVLDWLFPERVGKKYKANYAVPLGSGEFVVDIDSYLGHLAHAHSRSRAWNICHGCLEVSKAMAVHACEQIERYYSKLAVVFSGKDGFHIHVLDFNLSDWTNRNYRNLIKTHEVARFKFSQIISLQTYCFDRAHFILSVDPMRVITVPRSLNGESGLVCTYIGDRKDLELQTVDNIILRSQPLQELYGYPEPSNRWVMKHTHKTEWGNMVRVTTMTPHSTQATIDRFG